MNAIEKAKNDVWLDNSWESDEIARKVMVILEQAAKIYAVEVLEKFRAKFNGSDSALWNELEIRNRVADEIYHIKELRGKE